MPPPPSLSSSPSVVAVAGVMAMHVLMWFCLLASFPSSCEAFLVQSSTSFLGQSLSSWSNTVLRPQQVNSLRDGFYLSMDMEDPWGRNRALLHKYRVQVCDQSFPLPTATTQRPLQVLQRPAQLSVDDAQARHGMPWKSSIDPTYAHDELFYMPFWEWQLDFMKRNLKNLHVVPTISSQSGHDLAYRECDKVRMITLCFASDEYRKIRMTVYDAGNQVQVFTSLWYPRECYNLPVLGVDLLQFNQQRHLCVVDMQPIYSSSSRSDAAHAPYEHLLKPIRDQHPSLQGQMTKRFYDETQFFSRQMLLTRCEELENNNKEHVTKDRHPVYRDLMPAYQQYVQTHVDLIRSTPPTADPHAVRQGQAAYDAYSAQRDPAHAMFVKRFGKDFADDFVYNILFEYSGLSSSDLNTEQQQEQLR